MLCVFFSFFASLYHYAERRKVERYGYGYTRSICCQVYRVVHIGHYSKTICYFKDFDSQQSCRDCRRPSEAQPICRRDGGEVEGKGYHEVASV